MTKKFESPAFFPLPCPKFARLRTQHPFFTSSLSEVCSSSDTTPLFYLFLVRSLPDFGHNNPFLPLSCPKFARLRTQQRPFPSSLSEVCSSSDTTTLFSFSLVRSLPDFGHYNALSPLPCPKCARLRTPQPLFTSSLSEVCSTSDTTSPFYLFLVRSLPDFGHHNALSPLPCPKFARLPKSIISTAFFQKKKEANYKSSLPLFVFPLSQSMCYKYCRALNGRLRIFTDKYGRLVRLGRHFE